MREADTDGSDTLSFAELVTVTHKIKKDPNSTSATYVRKIHKAPAQVYRQDCFFFILYIDIIVLGWKMEEDIRLLVR